MNIKSLSLTPCDVDWPTGSQHKSHTKIDSEFEKNAIGHMTFAGRPTMLAGLIVHV